MHVGLVCGAHHLRGMARYLLCTGNAGKVNELRSMLLGSMELIGLQDVSLPTDLPETGQTFAANALEKARFAHERTGLACIADDSGLEVLALGGAPGVYSARYAGNAKDDVANIEKLLCALEGVACRDARFRTIIALVDANGEHLFEGEVRGTIATEPRGTNGFGYDPVFLPEGSTHTFAEMEAGRKNAISHRGHAVKKLVRYLTENHCG